MVSKRGKVIETGAALTKDVRPLARVRTNVILKAVALSKGGIAHVAFERLLARMHADMVLEIGRYSRRVRTVRTGVQDHALMDLDGDTTNDDDF